MLSAADARALKPNWDWKHAADRIETMIRLTAPSGRTSVDLPSDLLPDNGVGAWACGKHTPEAFNLIAILEEGGYRVTTDPGGHHGRGYVRIHWN